MLRTFCDQETAARGATEDDPLAGAQARRALFGRCRPSGRAVKRTAAGQGGPRAG